jgi:hypothetical protein
MAAAPARPAGRAALNRARIVRAAVMNNLGILLRCAMLVLAESDRKGKMKPGQSKKDMTP